MLLLLILLGLIAGALLPLQAGINNPMKTALGHPVLPALLTFAVGAAALFLYGLATRIPLPASQDLLKVSWWHWIGGGLCGALFLSLVVALTPRLGVALVFALIVAGEMAMALSIDHFGWMGLASHSINPGRLVGAAMLIGGVVLIHRF